MKSCIISLALAMIQVPSHGFNTGAIRRHQTSHIQSVSTDATLDAPPSTETLHTQTALSMTVEQLEKILGGWGRARLAWDCYSNGVDPASLFGDAVPSNDSPIALDEYADKLAIKEAVLPTPRVTQTIGKGAISLLSELHSHCGGTIENGLATLAHISTSSDGTTKLLLRLMDGFEVETVLIPFWATNTNRNEFTDDNKDDRASRYANLGRTTVCISSQVGCKQGCSFCATGKMGKLRSLSADEILAQLFYAKKIVRLSSQGILAGDVVLPPISNIVFMGMGEPADNANSVKDAIKIMTKTELFQLGATRITVSTVAPTPDAFMEFVDSKCVLAWSVHAVSNQLHMQFFRAPNVLIDIYETDYRPEMT
jgi:23S rRNA (adenine2503-C2)-methyltransferase